MQKVFYANQNLGSLLRQKRLEHGVSLKQAAESTKIREEYIVALENSDYKTLPASVYTKGFIKNYSAFLGINSKMTLALFRRESETEEVNKPKKVKEPKKEKPSIKLTQENLLIGLIILFVLGFVGFIVSRIIAVVEPPEFALTEPAELIGEEEGVYTTENDTITIRGTLEVGSDLFINDSEVDVKNLEIFEIVDIKLNEGENVFTLKAANDFGIESIIKLTVVRRVFVEENLNEIEEESNTVELPTEMNVDLKIQNRDANVTIKIDGDLVLNEVQQTGENLEFLAKNSFSIQTPRPDAIALSINGEIFTLDSSNEKTWILLEGKVVEKP